MLFKANNKKKIQIKHNRKFLENNKLLIECISLIKNKIQNNEQNRNKNENKKMSEIVKSKMIKYRIKRLKSSHGF